MNLSLLKIDPNDFSDPNHHYLYYFYNHPANNIWMYYSTRSKKDFRTVCKIFFAEMTATYLLQDEINGTKKTIGTCSIKHLPPPHAHVIYFSSLAIDPELHGKNFAKNFFVLLEKQLRIDFPEVFRCELSYGLNNPIPHTYRLYEKNGFKDEVVYHDFFRSGIPHYDDEENIFENWLAANNGDLRHLKNCWYADEIAAAYLVLPEAIIKNYQPLPKGWQNNIIISALSEIENKNLFLREATENDLEECVNLYFLSDTEWGFLDKAKLKKTLSENINQKRLWLVLSPHKILGIYHLLLAPPALEHTALLKQVAVLDKDIATSFFLFQSLLIFIKNNHPAIKRIEINITDDELHLAAGLIATDFQYRGTLACRLQTHHQKFLDEHVFEKSLFNLEDAIILCQNRLQTELFFKDNPQIGYPFNMPLTVDYLQSILQKLEIFQRTKTNNHSLPMNENKLYNIIKTICTQDLIPTSKRLEAIDQLEKL